MPGKHKKHHSVADGKEKTSFLWNFHDISIRFFPDDLSSESVEVLRERLNNMKVSFSVMFLAYFQF
jgi:hypothetical protein